MKTKNIEENAFSIENEKTEIKNVENIIIKIKNFSKEERFDFYIKCFSDVELFNIINGAVQYDE